MYSCVCVCTIAATYQGVHATMELVDTSPQQVWCAGAAAFTTAMVGLWRESFTMAGKVGRAAVIGGGLMVIKAGMAGVHKARE